MIIDNVFDDALRHQRAGKGLKGFKNAGGEAAQRHDWTISAEMAAVRAAHARFVQSWAIG